ncbi:ATP-binding protein [Mucilaginibacter sp.]|uniref:sensor histidine kinase n=1 Tax=Mucilaginibacter sp. TaxID=1882438 RepID=UPI003265E2B2
MDNGDLMLAICFVTALVVMLTCFFLYVLFLQRNKSNKFITERELMKANFNEQLLRSRLEMQEESFNAISMEIHDSVGQTLSLLKVQLNIIEQKEILDKVLLSEAKKNAGKAMSDLRDIAKSLSTAHIHSLSLMEMATHELQRINAVGIIEGTLLSLGEEKPVQNEKKLILFRMMQESCQNIIKHSGATRLTITILFNNENLAIKINDNGKGFNREILAGPGSGLGLQNIMSRALVIGGMAEIISGIDEGTTVGITVPYN